MEKKTIGALIAALRKVNGMTQKDLAERLNVSDKTVSRWECGEGVPDLSLIPVIAEIFGITCDELLRGQCNSASESDKIPDESTIGAKSEKQLRHLLKSTLSRYKNQTYVAISISFVGLITAMICNFAFFYAVLGSLLSMVFFAASVLCQAIFINNAFLRIEDAQIDTLSLSATKRTILHYAELSVGITVTFLGFVLPMCSVESYLRIEPAYLLSHGGVLSAIFLLIYAVIIYFLNVFLTKKGVFPQTDAQSEINRNKSKRRKKFVISLLAILLVTAFLQSLGHSLIWSTDALSSSYGVVFDDYESFISFMEQDVPALDHSAYSSSIAPLPEDDGETGDEMSNDALWIKEICDSQGNLLCRFVHRNQAVTYLEYDTKDGSALPIRALTSTERASAQRCSDIINALLYVLYPIEIMVTFFLYRKKSCRNIHRTAA